MNKPFKYITASINYISKNLLFILSVFLIAFIPLFPKIPLFDILPGYIVRVRIEDFLIVLAALIWIRDAYKKKFSWNTAFFWLVIVYAVVGLTSIFLGTILLQSIPRELLHIGKSALHFFRYMEYFALFFFLYSSVKTKQHIKIILVTLAFTIIGVVGYGFGQEYLHFPLYSTMNREYSKGQKLYLQENARPQSTFAGHYDLGAYLVIVLPIIFALSIGKLGIKKVNQEKYYKLFLHLIHIFGAWMLVTSGSKTALAAYLTGIIIVILFHLKKLSNLKQQLKWGGIALATLIIGLGLFLTIFGQETESTLISIAEKNPTVNKIISKIPGFSSSPTSPSLRPSDLYGDGHEFKIETIIDKEGNTTKKIVPKTSTWSENALKYGISMGIRLDTLWPQAIRGLINNPLFGNGYATLSQLNKGQFTEADSTDNNFLRTLGETGILGFITFYGLVLLILKATYDNTKKSNRLIRSLNIGFTGSIIGLLINATYIDVFAASKVAFTFWALAGLSIKSGLIDKILKNSNANIFIKKILHHFKKHWPFYIGFLILFFLLHKNPYVNNSLLRNFETSNEAIENVTTARCYINTGTFTVCRNNGIVLKNNPNLYSFLLIPVLKIYSDPSTFYFLNLILLIFIFSVIYKAISGKSNSTKFISLLIVISIYYLTSATSSPLTTSNLLILGILTPISAIFIAKFLQIQKHNLKIFLQLIIILVLTNLLYKSNFIAEIKTNFRNDKVTYKNWIIKRSNTFFNDKLAMNENKRQYLISDLNPYYFDFYKNDNYSLLPMSKKQDYFDKAEKVWNDLSFDLSSNQNKVDLNKTYENILQHEDKLYITDYGIYQNTNYLNSFNEIKKTYDLHYETIDCNDECNFYTVKTIQEKKSDIPKSINNKQLDLKKLSKNYSFSIFSNRFDPRKNPADLTHNIQTKDLLTPELKGKQQDFMIFMAESLYAPDSSWGEYFDPNFGSFSSYPILYGSTNYHKFFAKNDYFIFLNLNEKSEIDSKQKLFVYNAFLEIEKLPNIKNIFIIAENLNWQNIENESNFIHNLENKLLGFPNINKYIITADHNDELNTRKRFKNNVATKTHYLSYLKNTINYSIDTHPVSAYPPGYLEFSIDKDSNVTFEEVIFDSRKH